MVFLMKKLIALFLAILILSLSVPFTASAEQLPDLSSLPLILRQAVTSGEINDSQMLKRLELYNAVYNGLKNCETEIDISNIKFSLAEEDYNTLLNDAINYLFTLPDIFWVYDYSPSWSYRVFGTNREFWYVDLKINYAPCSFDSNGNYIYFNSEKMKAAKLDFNSRVNEITEKIPADFSDVEKLLYLQDYFAVNYEYVVDDSTNFDAYSFLSEKKGVCDAYAKAYIAVLEKLNIPCMRAISIEGNHAWTIVKLDGEYYHIDSTWSDPLPDRNGQAEHYYFLLSDDKLTELEMSLEIENRSHINWFCKEEELFFGDINCDSKKYDNGYIWQDTSSVFCYFNGEHYYVTDYYITNNYRIVAVIRKTKDFKVSQTVTTLSSDYWYISALNGNYFITENNISLSIIGSQLYYSTANSVRYFDIITKEDNKLFDVKGSNILGFSYLGNGKFQYTEYCRNKDYAYYDKKEYTLQNFGRFNIGDDNQSIATSLVSIRKFLINNDSTGLCLLQGDLHGNDGKIDVRDIVAMKKLALSL